MGIRLYKKLGWGLTDVQHEGGRVADPRINAEALSRRFDEGDTGPEYLKYLKYLESLESLRETEAEPSEAWMDLSMVIAMVEASLEQEGALPWPVTRETESGRQDLLLIQPVGFTNWTRYGDAIDQNEENALHPGEYFRIVPMPYGIYPFEGLYMDSRDGRRLDSTAKGMMGRLIAKAAEGERGERFLDAAEHLARTMGFENTEQARKYIAPIVPPDVRLVISWLDLFKDPDVWLRLRPMLYVYWS